MNLFKELLVEIKKNPLETIGSFVFITMLFGLFYVSIWIGCPC
jgi:hypothetical protein